MAYGKPGKRGNLALMIAGGLFAVGFVVLLVLRLTEGEQAGDPTDGDGDGDALAVVVPTESGYPDPPSDGEWDTDTLDEETFVQVTAESTCMAQSFHGPPDELTREMDRIYFHYETTASQVAMFASEVNADDANAIRVGERIADAIERCP